MHISDGTWPASALRPMPALPAWLLSAFDAPPTGDRDPTVDVVGIRALRNPRRPPRSMAPRLPAPKIQKLELRPSRPAPVVHSVPRWGLVLGIASSATLLVAAMGVLSLIGVVALYLMA